MKKIIYCLIIALVVCLSATACGENQDKDGSSAKSTAQQETETQGNTENEETPTETPAETPIEDWGVAENIISKNNSMYARAHLKFPGLSGRDEGTGKIAYQLDETLVILDSQCRGDEPEVEGDLVENVFPAYLDKAKKIMKAYRGVRGKDFEFNINEKESVVINGYDMCKYVGEHTYTFNDEEKSIAFVAYATKLKTNGAFVYWMVLDESEDQSLGDLIESHAENMAKTLYDD